MKRNHDGHKIRAVKFADRSMKREVTHPETAFLVLEALDPLMGERRQQAHRQRRENRIEQINLVSLLADRKLKRIPR